jgi:hypothetical protein
LNDSLFSQICENESKINLLKNKNVICDGFFQKDILLVKYRKELLNFLKDSDDLFKHYITYTESYYVKFKDFYNKKTYFSLEEQDIVISLRLDDFNHSSVKYTTNIVPPEFYTDVLEKIKFNRLIIVSDKIRKQWEKIYISNFEKYNPILLTSTLEDDCSVLLSCKRIIHSNSTLCWIMSYLSEEKKERFIPLTNFYDTQKLEKIEDNDKIIEVIPMEKSKLDSMDKI